MLRSNTAEVAFGAEMSLDLSHTLVRSGKLAAPNRWDLVAFPLIFAVLVLLATNGPGPHINNVELGRHGRNCFSSRFSIDQIRPFRSQSPINGPFTSRTLPVTSFPVRA